MKVVRDRHSPLLKRSAEPVRPRQRISQPINAPLPLSSTSRAQFGAGAVEDNGFLRQPFETGRASHVENYSLARPGAMPSDTICRTRRSQQCAGHSASKLGAQFKLIAAGDAPRWMDDDRVTNLVAFRIERLLNYQRTVVTPRRQNSARGAPFELEREMSTPCMRLAASVFSISPAITDLPGNELVKPPMESRRRGLHRSLAKPSVYPPRSVLIRLRITAVR